LFDSPWIFGSSAPPFELIVLIIVFTLILPACAFILAVIMVLRSERSGIVKLAALVPIVAVFAAYISLYWLRLVIITEPLYWYLLYSTMYLIPIAIYVLKRLKKGL